MAVDKVEGSAAVSRSREELLRLADLSLAEYFRHLARQGGAILEEDGLLLFAGAHPQPNPYRNGALRLDGRLAADEVLGRAEAFFSARRRGYVLWAREHADSELDDAMRSTATPELDRLPELVLDTLPDDLPPLEGVELRRPLDPQTQWDYLRLVADAWGMRGVPLDVAARVFFDPASLEEPNVVAFVAYFEGTPLSAAMCLVSSGVALGCQAATPRVQRDQRLPPAAPPGERRGLAQSCLCAALKVSFEELGASFALGQTSPSGAHVWEALGFAPLTSYTRYALAGPRPAPA